MRVVIDTNVLVSALLNEHGAEASVVFAVADQKLLWCVSPAILAEYEAVLRRPKFSKIPAGYITALLILARQAQVFTPSVRLKISPHAADNRFYECASAANASSW
jgi:putative PIN family toxin of toxin-antitoxin system